MAKKRRHNPYVNTKDRRIPKTFVRGSIGEIDILSRFVDQLDDTTCDLGGELDTREDDRGYCEGYVRSRGLGDNSGFD